MKDRITGNVEDFVNINSLAKKRVPKPRVKQGQEGFHLYLRTS